MTAVAYALLGWLILWAVGKFFEAQARRRRFEDERRGLSGDRPTRIIIDDVETKP